MLTAGELKAALAELPDDEVIYLYDYDAMEVYPLRSARKGKSLRMSASDDDDKFVLE